MRCLIDKTVLHAGTYYKTYGEEPSPAGTIAIKQAEITVIDEIDFKTVLEEMKTLGAKGELMVVTHSNPKGLKMPLIKPTTTAAAETALLEKLVTISQGIARREAIGKLPEKQQPKAWQTWFRDFDPDIKLEDGYETNPDWKSYVEGKYNEWFLRQGARILKLPNPRQDLTDLITLLNEVRALGFGRLEFRACRIGTDTDTLKKLAGVLNVTKLIAPKEVRTFFGSIAKVDILSDKDFEKKKKTLGARQFPDARFLLMAGEHLFQAFATADDEVRKFITKYVLASYKGSITPFIMGGLEPTGKSVIAGKKHVFPLDSDYLGLLAMFDGSTPAAPPLP
ncbi:MAG: hypothetical protein IT162_00250 [Bryobacterales bacterium]|nr:hypothetical protein [Bryobacterales bacterium]